MSKSNLIKRTLLIVFVFSVIAFGVSATLFGGLDSNATDILIININRIILITSGSLSGLVGISTFLYNYVIYNKVNRTYDYYVKKNHKYDVALEIFAKYSRLITSDFIEKYIDLHVAYTYLRIANYDQCEILFNKLYEKNSRKSRFMFSFIPLYYLSLICYVKDKTEEMNNYIVKINDLLEKSKRIIFRGNTYSTHIAIIKALEEGNKSKLRELILLQCDGDPNKLIFIKDIYKK